MHSRFHLIKKYIYHHLAGSNGKGHGIHSPFVFDFVKNVLRDRKKYEQYPVIETARQRLLQQTAEIEVADFGAGSSFIKTSKRKVSDIAASSLKSAKYAQLLYRIVKYYQPKTILELGTSFGVTSSYLALANSNSKLFTIEGSPAIAAIASKTFERVGVRNVELIEGDFDKVLPPLLTKLGNIDLAFIDGNHRKAPTLSYFQQLLAYSHPSTIMIFDDIHWSREMEEAWVEIQRSPRVTLTIDLFFIGIVFVNPDFKIKQDFKIRF